MDIVLKGGNTRLCANASKVFDDMALCYDQYLDDDTTSSSEDDDKNDRQTEMEQRMTELESKFSWSNSSYLKPK